MIYLNEGRSHLRLRTRDAKDEVQPVKQSLLHQSVASRHHLEQHKALAEDDQGALVLGLKHWLPSVIHSRHRQIFSIIILNNNNKRFLFTMNLINYTIYLPKGRELKK